MPIKYDNLDPSLKTLISQADMIPGAAERHMVYSSGTAAPYMYFRSRMAGDRLHSTLALAHAAATSLRNDVVLLTPESHTQSQTLTWSKSVTHLVGAYGPALMNLRSRIGHTGVFNKLMSITGYGNTFANLYTMYGNNDDTDVAKIGIDIVGNRQTFVHCHIGGPFGANEADQADFSLVKISETSGGDGLEHYFNHCCFGTDTTAWTNGTMFRIAGTPRLVFEDCLFPMRADNAQVTFFNGTAGDGQGFILFKNSTGFNLGTALTVAIGSTGIAAGTDIIIHNSGFTGCTDLIAAADEAKAIAVAQVGNATDDVFIGLGIPADHTA